MVKMSTSMFPKQKSFQTSSELLGLGRNGIFGRIWLLLSQPFSNIGIFPRLGASAVRNLHIIDQRATFSVLGTLSRACSVPLADGPSLSCAYHMDILVPEPTKKSLFSSFQRSAVPVCSYMSSRTASFSQHVGAVERKNGKAQSSVRTFISCRQRNLDSNRINGGLHVQESAVGRLVFRCMWTGSTMNNWRPVSCFDLWKDFRLSFVAASDVSFDRTPQDEHLETSLVEENRKPLNDRPLKLLSGSCYLPHPDKEETGGEDAHFICDDEPAIGVADGVGGWADLGVDAGQYAKELMSNSVSAIRDEPKGLINPLRVLEKAYSSTKAKGSSTACIVALTSQGLHAVNLGDSGFIVIRDGCTIFRSPVQQHDFNFTYQLESGNGSDLPSSAQVFIIPVEAGDVIVAGTDGLFDNLYNNEITAIVVHAVRARLGPQVTAQKIAALARQRAQDKNRQTPFSTAAQDAGYRYYGGKLDDITVVVSFITNASVA
ncbi:putative protein phosphatase 2C 55 [Apostasia shenzhenica]|uniref:Protein phosphatase n=1 Tax=Apostasia shenzhenica TaxID=1088818 RepID=A0A2I0AID6_9ASPA|nr:putative protein phosphatase 2C 55 [Apostasia shenzhenica]